MNNWEKGNYVKYRETSEDLSTDSLSQEVLYAVINEPHNRDIECDISRWSGI
jgi:hypothetical protein